MYIIFLGAPGAGKGTQAALLTGKLGAVHISTGDLFRRRVKEGGELGELLKSYMDKGLLVPDEVTVKMLTQEIESAKRSEGVVFDGFPRNLAQAKALDAALKKQGKAIDKVINIKVADKELIRRLSGRWICRVCQAPYHLVTSPPKRKGFCDRCGGELYQRDDDTPQTVKKRLDVYLKEAQALIDYYKKQGKLAEVEGEGEPGGVAKRILTALSVKV